MLLETTYFKGRSHEIMQVTFREDSSCVRPDHSPSHATAISNNASGSDTPAAIRDSPGGADIWTGNDEAALLRAPG